MTAQFVLMIIATGCWLGATVSPTAWPYSGRLVPLGLVFFGLTYIIK